MKIYTYYDKYTGKSDSIIKGLEAVGVTDTSKEARKKIAILNGITKYNYTAAQNTKLLNLLKSGKLIKKITYSFPKRNKFLERLSRYSDFIKQHGSMLFYSFSESESSFAKAKAKILKGKKTGITCVVPCRWALRAIGISPYGFWAKNGTFSHCYKGSIKTHLKRITSGRAIGKTIKQAVEAKLLKPGDILCFKGRTHTFVYSGIGYLVYDGGHAANYSKTGILVDYSKKNAKYQISEILRWKD